jgi:hypothetical protein
MNTNHLNIGFTYFSTPDALVARRINAWMPVLHSLGSDFVIFSSGFKSAVPEDVISSAAQQQMETLIHFREELPLARFFNEAALLINAYAKWGVNYCILGDRPNLKASWPSSGWQYENLVDHFLDRFIPLASHSVRVGIRPVLAPMQPGGDYWDTAFLELVLSGLQRRRLESILDQLILSCYGWTFERSLDWGAGGPDSWPDSKPYQKKDNQQDQLGFRNFEWVQSVSRKTLQRELPILILDCGNTGHPQSSSSPFSAKTYPEIVTALLRKMFSNESGNSRQDQFPAYVLGCGFSLPHLQALTAEPLTPEKVQEVFDFEKETRKKTGIPRDGFFSQPKSIRHYLLLPEYNSSISDAMLNKVRPFIKRHRPTIGFSLSEAALAEKVTVYNDPSAFPIKDIDHLRMQGCHVEILPDSGIDIAASLDGSPSMK